MSHLLQFLVFTMAGWLNRQQQDLIDYLREENRILREQLGGRPLCLTDEQRRRLVVRGKVLGRKALGEVAGIVTPDTILRWYRKLIAKKYDGSAHRGRGRPTTSKQIADLVVRMAERDAGLRPGLTTEERQRLKELERENRALKRANEILRKASAYFAQAELDRRPRR